MPGLVGIPRVLRLIVHGVGAPGLVPLHTEGLGSPRPRDGGQGLLQRGLLQAQGHLQEVDRHLEGLYFDHRVGLVSGENSSPACRGMGRLSSSREASSNPSGCWRASPHHRLCYPCTTAAPALVANTDGTWAGKRNLGHLGALSVCSPTRVWGSPFPFRNHSAEELLLRVIYTSITTTTRILTAKRVLRVGATRKRNRNRNE